MTTLFDVADPTLLLVMIALIFVSSALQTATGFGFAILSAPVGAALLGGPQAITTVLITGTAVDLMILFLRRQPRQPRWDEVGILAVSSVPGLLVGAYLLAVMPTKVLLMIIALAVGLAVGFRIWSRLSGHRHALTVSRCWGVAAGAISGVLATSTTLAGPPTVYYLSHRPYSPATIRDTLVFLNLARLPLSVIALAIGGVFLIFPGVGWLAIAAVAGFFVGSRIFARLDARRYENLVMGLLVTAAATAAVLALVT